jgi:N-sulfoglucosamine sulfohydrolase
MNRRFGIALLLVVSLSARLYAAEKKPLNFLFIVGEDMGPELGCYGDSYARTPNLDKFAKEGALFTRAFTHAPVCAPSRTGIITGQYPSTIGAHHHRSKLIKEPPMFTSHLRKAGYFVAWPGKTDFNFVNDPPADAFDSRKKWTDREPGKPFFAYINLFETHESQIRAPKAHFEKNIAQLKPDERHDPAKAPLPPYYPDVPETRRDLANYYDLCTAVDYKVGEVLAELEKRGEADNTVVFFFGDHGRGLPRGKRWLYDSGIRVPLIVRWPGKIQPGAVREDLVCFLDLAPTILSLTSVGVPKELQGQVFLGPSAAKERQYIFAARDRMDETFDSFRAVRDKQFKYIRNLHPELPYSQRVAYGEEMPTMKAWRKANADGKLSGAQKIFFSESKPKEELYDTAADPHEVVNLAEKPEHQQKLVELRAAMDKWIADTGDLGALPESELVKRGLVKDVLESYENRKVK